MPVHSAAEQSTTDFERDVAPILLSRCIECHQSANPSGGLSLQTATAQQQGGDSGPAVRPGDADGSLLISRVLAGEMPPPANGHERRLPPAEAETLRRWVTEGATFPAGRVLDLFEKTLAFRGGRDWWSFQPLSTTAPPEPVSIPWETWRQHPIDRFLAAGLQRSQLSPAPPATARELIRRLYWDLTGLPPQSSDTELAIRMEQAGARTLTAPQYQQLVDRLLASPQFGERWARHWLDVARYADTHGLHLDNEREMWAWRDWVISAFNQNLPFDQFTTWQLAGDLLPNPTLEQKVATGFNRCNVTTSEGGAINEEWLYRYAVDRTSTTMQTWMGLTAGCAVCHDHKYDPITSRDFYSMYAFFYSAADPGMDGNISRTQPFLKVATPDKQNLIDAALARLKAADAALEQSLDAAEAAGMLTDEPADPQAERSISDLILDDVLPPGSRTRNTSRNDPVWVRTARSGDQTDARSLELAYGAGYDLTIDLTLIPVPVPAAGTLSVDIRIDPHHPPRNVRVQYDDGRSHRFVWTDVEDAAGGKREGRLPSPGVWHTLDIPLAKSGSAEGSRIKSLVLSQDGGRVFVDSVRISGQLPAGRDPRASFTAWWQMSKGTNPDGISPELQKLLNAGPSETADAAQVKLLKQFWRRVVQRSADSPVTALRQAQWQAHVHHVALLDEVPGTFMFTDLPNPRDAFVMERGQYDKPGAKVEPGVPAEFPPLRSDSGAVLQDRRANRLDLARWFTAAENPLTARVTVNRIWQQVFGTGLVRTSDDFGTRGDPPSHPELLDWLAVEFRNSGWDQKQFYRMLLSSATFRQQSMATELALQRDFDNRLLSRGTRFRLDAEQLRDNVLFVSGLLNPAMGGRGVMPYQPPDIWEPVGYENSNTRFYLQEHGSALYRRSIYCFVKRTAPPPFMTNFDAPNREQFCSRRERSNTPLQALQLMNDIQHFEAARVLAQRLLEAPGDDNARITLLLRIVLARSPAADELHILKKALEAQRQHFTAHPENATRVIRNGEAPVADNRPHAELAAWSMLSSLVLNLDETVCRN